ncbi:hypothetical protein IPN35_03260 [Candidatus Peregrinibacteria bacterium]|nr:MAG: hypothetical protein IPN35_03260 [Candidatus Peregrinibacteria bacterium]
MKISKKQYRLTVLRRISSFVLCFCLIVTEGVISPFSTHADTPADISQPHIHKVFDVFGSIFPDWAFRSDDTDTWGGQSTFEAALSAQISAMNGLFGNTWIAAKAAGLYDKDDGAIATYSGGKLQVTKDIHSDGNIDSDGNIITDGVIGIGVASPTDQLEISASSGSTEVRIDSDNSTTVDPAGINISDFSTGEAYRIGSDNSASGVQAKYGGALDIYSDQTIRLLGDRESSGVEPAFSDEEDIGVQIINSTATNPALVVDSAAGQTGNLQEWRNSSGTPIAVVSKNGFIGVGVTSPTVPFDSNQPIRAIGASVGTSCTIEGAFGYDSNSETLVLCDTSGQWEQVSVQGEAGNPGLDGADGATWFSGTTLPTCADPATAVDGDRYLVEGDNTDPDAGKHYSRNSVTDPVNCWLYEGNLMGPEGPAPDGTFQFVYTDDGTAKSANMYYNEATGNVGIGTTSPTAPLQVTGKAVINSGGGSVVSPQSLNVVGNGDQEILLKSNDNTGLTGIQFQGAGYRGDIYATGNYTITINPNSYYASGGSGGGSGSGNIFLNNTSNGNVVVGNTIYPTGLFVVNQKTTSTGYVSVSGTDISGVNYGGGQGGTQFLNTFKPGDTITVTTSWGSETRTIATVLSNVAMTVTAPFTGTATKVGYTLIGGDRFVVQGNGNVGIGTTSPTEKLDVNGNINFTGELNVNSAPGTSGQVLTSNGDGSAPSWVDASTVGTTDHGALTGLTDDDHTQYALLAGRSGGQSLTGGTGVTDKLVLQGTSANGTSTAAALQVNVGNNGGTNALTVLNNGNVGIGTTNPKTKFHVSGGMILTPGTVTGSSGFLFRDNSGVLELVSGAGGGNLGFKIRTGVVSDSGTGTINNTAIVVHSLSGVSIGIDNNNAWGGAALSIGNESFQSNLDKTILSVKAGATQTEPLTRWKDSSGTTLSVVDASGNIGIGTASPTYALAFGNTKDRAVGVESTGGDTAGKALVLSAGNTGTDASTDFVSLGQTTRDWRNITTDSSGNIYAVVWGGDIYKQTGGTGDFLPLGQTSRNWYGITTDSSGNIYAVVWGGDIYKQTGGTGDFLPLGQTSRNWYGITTDSSGNIYAANYSGDIYKQTGGTGDFLPLGQTSRLWTGMTTTPSGNVYAAVFNGDIYKQTGGTGDFLPLGQASRTWFGMTTTPSGDVYAAVRDGDIYKQTGGTGDFLPLGQTSRAWYGITADSSGNIYAVVSNGGIYELFATSGGTPNLSGGQLVLSSGAGKGTGASTISFKTGTTLSSGNTLQPLQTKMTILGNGNVGIGTTSPTEKLDVNGNINFTGELNINSVPGTSGQVLTSGGDGSAPTWVDASTVGTTDHGALTGLTDDDHTQYALLAGRSGGQSLTGGTDAGDNFTLSSTANATKGTINLGSTAYIDELNGRVGIGTASPNAKLHVDGSTIFDTDSGNQKFYLTRLGAVGEHAAFSVNDSDFVVESRQDEATGTTGNVIFKMGGKVSSGQTPYFAVRSWTESGDTQTELLKVDGTKQYLKGNVGIGTTSPSVMLDVNGAGKFAGNVNMSGNSITNLATPADTDTTYAATVEYVNNKINGLTWKDPVDDADETDGLGTLGACDSTKESWATYNKNDGAVYVCNGTDWVLIGASASIPYATTSNAGILELSGVLDGTWNNVGITDDSLVDADVNSAAAISGTKISPDFGSQNVTTTGSLTVDTNTLVVDSATDNVGIGTASPNAKLHIKTDTGTNSEIDIQSGAENHWGIYQDETTADLRFWNTDNRLTITDGGNIGIGTTSPTYALAFGNTKDRAVGVESTGGDTAGKALVLSAGNTGTDASTDFVSLGQTSRTWYGMTTDSNGNVYATVSNGDIYKQTGGTGNFLPLGQTSRNWYGITTDSSGNIYAAVWNGDIYKQTGGTGDFLPLGQASRNWTDMTNDSSGNVYATAYTGDIYKQTGGTGDFLPLGQTSRNWRSITADSNGNVYAADYSGDIYKQTGGTGDFLPLEQTTRYWYGMTADSSGNIYAAVSNGDIYKQTGGTGDFLPLGQTSRLWRNMTADSNGNVYAAESGGGIYELFATSGGTPNLSGGQLVLTSGAGKGAGASTISFKTGTTLSSGNTLQSLQTKMTILGNGNVGIGTTSPTEKLDVNGNINFTGELNINSAPGTSGQVLTSGGDGSAPTWVDASTVGTTDHGALTGLTDDDHTQYALLAGRSGGQSLTGGTDAGDNFTLSSTANATKGTINLGSTAYIDELNGRVGIGTASPNAKLHIKTDTGTNSEIDIQSGAENHWGIYQDETTADLRFWNTDDRLTITDGGNIGIGTTSPTYTLAFGNTQDRAVGVESTGGDTAGKALVLSAGNTGTDASTNFVSLGQASREWHGMTTDSNGNVYASVHNGDIYKQTGGTGDFLPLGQTTRLWTGMTADSSGNVYAAVWGGDIYKQTGGTGNFIALGQTSRYWYGMTTDSSGNIYASTYTGDIYKQTGGTGDFLPLGQTSRNWRSITADSSGNVYATTDTGDIYKQTGGTGDFLPLGQASRQWHGITTDSSGNIYAAVWNGDIYKQTGGTGDFLPLGQTSRLWRGMTADPNGNIYAPVYGGGIYELFATSGGTPNLSGGQLVLTSGAGKGTGASTISFKTGTTLSSGNTLQSLQTKMTILGNGNVGIGTTSPTEKLDVNGNINFTGELNVNSAPGTSGQVLTSNGDGSAPSWVDASGGAWGEITGTISDQTDLQDVLDAKLNITGGTMTGDLVLAGDPDSDLKAATKQYVDNLINGLTWKDPIEITETDAETKYGTCDTTTESWATYNKNDDTIYICNGDEWIEMSSTVGVPFATDAIAGKVQLTGEITGSYNNVLVADNVIDEANLKVTNSANDNYLLTFDNATNGFTWIDPTTLTTAETNDLTSAVTWANVPDANITESSVTQHEGALTITESQISDLGSYLENVVEDTTPQLGGDLDVNGHKIVSASNGNIEVAPNGTGDFFVNTDDLYVDTSTGNVGIGTIAPVEKLTVEGNLQLGSIANALINMPANVWGDKWYFAGPYIKMAMDQASTSWLTTFGGTTGLTKFRWSSTKQGGINGPILDLETGGMQYFTAKSASGRLRQLDSWQSSKIQPLPL